MLAAALVAGGAIVDARFRRRSHRAALAEALGRAAVFLECRALATVIAEWATSARRNLGECRTPRPRSRPTQLAEFEPLEEVAPERHLVLRTDRPQDDALDELEAALDGRLEALSWPRTSKGRP